MTAGPGGELVVVDPVAEDERAEGPVVPDAT